MLRVNRYFMLYFLNEILFRYQRFEKAFLLAVDIGAKDLFMVRINIQVSV